MAFTKQTFVITGASVGIGRELAIALCRQGANVVVAARNATDLAETVCRCEAAATVKATALAVPTDVTQPPACQHLIQTAVASFGQLDGLVNNAGISCVARFEAITDLSIFAQVMQVNYLGAVYCTHYALPALKQSKGLLVAVSSLSGKTGLPTRSAYAASKHAMQGFFDTLRIELRGTGVDVLVVSPGFVATGIRERALRGDGQLWGESPRDETQKTMTVETCVAQILKGMAKRQREVVMTPKGKVLPWAKLLVPGLVDALAARAMAR